MRLPGKDAPKGRQPLVLHHGLLKKSTASSTHAAFTMLLAKSLQVTAVLQPFQDADVFVLAGTNSCTAALAQTLTKPNSENLRS